MGYGDVPSDYPKLPARLTLKSEPVSVEQEIELIDRQGGNCDWVSLRKRMFHGLGIMDRFRSRAKNVIFFGCNYPATTHLGFQSYLELLDELGIEYTFPAAGEFCCGIEALRRARGEQERARAEEAVKDFIGRNIEIAGALGAERMMYRCVWCVTAAKRYYPDCSIKQEYYADVLVSALKDQRLSVEPIRIGYYPPCYEKGREMGGGRAWLPWGAYSRLLGQIEGLTVVNLKPQDCCNRAAADSIRVAKSEALDTIVTHCNSCIAWLGMASEGSGIRLRLLPEVLLDAVRGRTR